MKAIQRLRWGRRVLAWGMVVMGLWLSRSLAETGSEAARPNVLLAIADDWGYPHAGAYGDPVVKTPTFDRLAREGIRFDRAFVSSPSCTPSRSALMTGQFHWRLEEAANLWSTLQARFRTYPERLAEAGYFIGHTRKAWGPGRLEPGGRRQDPAGPRFKDLAAFLDARPTDTPFCFWLGSPDPHRPYDAGTGAARGIDLNQVPVPGCLPDVAEVRSDLADYYFEVERFDREVGEALRLLEARGLLSNTLVVMTGDHGMPFPRAKSNLYDLGVRVPLAACWKSGIAPGQVEATAFVSLTDLAPTFLELAGMSVPAEMTGRSLAPLWREATRDAERARRDSVVFGKERHVPSQEAGNTAGYPGRALRTGRHLLIRNYRPELWPNGIADGAKSEKGNAFADCDDGPTKTFVVAHREEPEYARFFQWSFAKRPGLELYDLERDPEQLENVASRPEYAETLRELEAHLTRELRRTGDPRVVGGGERFERYPYYGSRLGPSPAGRP